MAEDQDKSQKTEEPTQRRIEEAVRQGRVAFSREVNTFILLLLMTIFISWVLPTTLRYGDTILSRYISEAHLTDISEAKDIANILRRGVVNILAIGAIPLLIALVASVLGNFLQNGFMIAPEALRFDLSRISIISGFGRLFSLNSLVEFVKSCLKVICVVFATYIAISNDLSMLYHIKEISIAEALRLCLHCLVNMMIAVVVVMAAIALLDYLYQKYNYIQSLMMTRTEVKEEMKQSDGDPEIKAKLRSIRAERSRKRMMSMVPRADVVITNPTHYAIALQYEPSEMPAPKVIAKGSDAVALRIREVAIANDIPIIENPPLARLLYETVKLDQYIKPDQYEAVARLIFNILRLKKKV